MANPFSLTPDFPWVDQGADEGALVRAAAEVAAGAGGFGSLAPGGDQ